jgi:hypothetical protein
VAGISTYCGNARDGDTIKNPVKKSKLANWKVFLFMNHVGIASDPKFGDNGFSGAMCSAQPLEQNKGWIVKAVSVHANTGGMANVKPQPIDVSFIIVQVAANVE